MSNIWKFDQKLNMLSRGLNRCRASHVYKLLTCNTRFKLVVYTTIIFFWIHKKVPKPKHIIYQKWTLFGYKLKTSIWLCHIWKNLYQVTRPGWSDFNITVFTSVDSWDFWDKNKNNKIGGEISKYSWYERINKNINF